jgi:hypothetical protein
MDIGFFAALTAMTLARICRESGLPMNVRGTRRGDRRPAVKHCRSSTRK